MIGDKAQPHSIKIPALFTFIPAVHLKEYSLDRQGFLLIGFVYIILLKGRLTMKKLSASILLLVGIAVLTAGLCSRADAAQKYYSVQVKAVPLAEKKDGFAIYNDLKRKGYLVYYYKARVKDEWWMRVRLGVFATIPEAQAFGETFKKNKGFDFVVTKADILVYPYRNEYEIVATPSAIWMRKDTKDRELYRYSHYKIYTSDKPGNVSVVITDDGKEGEIIHDYFTYTINLATGKKHPFQRKGAYKVNSEARFPAENRLVRIVADSSTYNQKTKRDTYNKLLILEHRDQEKIVKSILMKAYPGFEFSHFIPHVHRGKTRFVVIQGRSTFAIYDVKRDAFSGAVVPHRDQKVLGVDGRSGSLNNLKLSKDGRTLTGKVIHSGLFAYDLTVPGKPNRIYFKNNVETDE